MTILRAIVPALLLSASACVRTPATTELAPKLGPDGSIRALYDGGLLQRRVSAHFTVEQSSYALVGHLGGDGVIRIVYPERAQNAWVKPGQLYRTEAFSGDYDGAPSYYFMSVTRIRGAGARSYSYDGRGHSFVFLILSRRPFQLGQVSDFGLWNEFEVSDYRYMNDPRVAVRAFADAVTGGHDYTIRYAHSFTTYAYTSYADAMWDCSLLAYGFGGMWSDLNSWSYYSPHSRQCAGYYGYAFGFFPGWYGYGYPFTPPRPVFNAPVTPPPVTPVAQRTPRPTFIPTNPTERRGAERRAATATAYKPTWADNPSFAPAPTDRRASSPRRPTWAGTSDRQTRDRWADNARRGRESSGTSSPSPSTSSGSGSSGTSSQPAPAPAPTMSPGRSGGSSSGRRPPA